MKITKEKLREFNACTGGYKWFLEQYPDGNAEIKELIERIIAAKRHDDANWLLSHIMNRKQRIAYAIFAAEQVIHIYEKQYPSDSRPRAAIEAAKAVLKQDTKANQEKLAAARAAARAAACAAARAAAEAAAWATARDAACDAARAAACAAACDAAEAAACAAARDAMMEKILRNGLDIIRKRSVKKATKKAE